MQIKKQQLEPDMEQRSGSKLGNEYVKAVYCDPAYLNYMQSERESCSVVSQLFATPWTMYIVHGILQARILEWVAVPFSRESSQPRD